jgi:transposase
MPDPRHGAIEVASSRKHAKSETYGRKTRSTGTKARARVRNGPNSLIELQQQLEERTRERDLAGVRRPALRMRSCRMARLAQHHAIEQTAV